MLRVKYKGKIDKIVLFGTAGLLVLILMGMMMPVVAESAEAMEDVVPFADSKASAQPTVTLAVSGENKKTLMPTDESYDVAKIDAKVTIGLTNSSGYSIQLEAATEDLVGTSNSAHKIPAVSGVSTLANMPVNTWGYSIDGNTYRAAPTESAEIYKSGNLDISNTLVNREHILSFATKVDLTVAPDVYGNTVIVSVVSDPNSSVMKAFNGIKTMQELTPEVCREAGEHDTAFLTDTRDGNQYWVTKMKDGNCWMSQDLALDLTKGKVVQGSKVVEGTTMTNYAYTPEATTQKPSDGNGRFSSISGKSFNSWNEGKYVMIKPGGVASKYLSFTAEQGGLSAFADDSKLTSLATGDGNARVEDFGVIMNVSASWWKPATDPYFTESNVYIQDGVSYNKTAGWAVDLVNKVYDAHYLIGNYYQWYAATAMTVGDGIVIDYQMTRDTSICPLNWRLSDYGRFRSMLSEYDLTTKVSNADWNILSAPLYFMRAGSLNSSGVSGVGSMGYFSTATASVYYLTSVATLTIFADNTVRFAGMNGASSFGADSGAQIRCMVVAPTS